MDPIANIAEQRKLATAIIALEDGTDDTAWCDELPQLAVRLSELVQALDEWRSKGGFDPYTTR